MATRLQIFVVVLAFSSLTLAFGQKAEGALTTRKFKLDMGALPQSKRPFTPGPLHESNADSLVQQFLQARLASAGILFAESPINTRTLPNEKVMFLNERTGELFVRATLADLQEIEKIVAQMQMPLPTVELEARFVEVAVAETPIPFRPMQRGFTNVLVFTEKEFRDAIRRYENSRGVDILTAPKVATMSGRQARLAVEESRPTLYQDPPRLPRDTSPDADPTPRNQRRLPFPPGFMPSEGAAYGAIRSGPIAE
jgi:hypothetical protein